MVDHNLLCLLMERYAGQVRGSPDGKAVPCVAGVDVLADRDAMTVVGLVIALEADAMIGLTISKPLEKV